MTTPPDITKPLEGTSAAAVRSLKQDDMYGIFSKERVSPAFVESPNP